MGVKKIKISVIVLAGGDYDRSLFEKYKKSYSWANEVLEIDTSKVKGSYADWRTEGLKKAKGDWILYIDTDEEVSNSLRKEILSVISHKRSLANFVGKSSAISSYAIPRKNIIFGKEFKHGGQYPDYQKRLFLKKHLKKWTGDVHEEPVFIESANRRIGHLKNPIIHHKNVTLSQMVDKTNNWSEIEADLLFKSNHPRMNIVRFATAAFREFWLRFIKQACILDGKEGIIYGMYQIYSRLITYSKLWEKQLNESSNL